MGMTMEGEAEMFKAIRKKLERELPKVRKGHPVKFTSGGHEVRIAKEGEMIHVTFSSEVQLDLQTPTEASALDIIAFVLSRVAFGYRLKELELENARLQYVS